MPVTLLAECAVLKALVEKASKTRDLDHDECVVLVHTLAHLDVGRRAVNYLFEQCPGLESHRRLARIHRGQPISCPRIRQRLPHLTATCACHCAFPARPDHYPTPMLHLDEARWESRLKTVDAGVDRRAVEAGRAYSRLLDEHTRLRRELDALRNSLVDALEKSPERALHGEGGTWRLTDRSGAPVLAWEPDTDDGTSCERASITREDR